MNETIFPLATTMAEVEPRLDRDDRLRRSVSLCCDVARNLAYHRGRRVSGSVAHKGVDFWDTAEGHFLGAAVLAWCALFANDDLEQEKHAQRGWRELLPEPDHEAFERELPAAMGLSAEELAKLIEVARRYRDKVMAHLDSDKTMRPAQTEAVMRATRFLYNRIRASAPHRVDRGDALPDLDEVYWRALAESVRIYGG